MIVGTRGSRLATVQTKYVISKVSEITNDKIDMKIIKTTGDKITDSQLYQIDTKGIFTKELDKAVLDEEVDFAVHSLKDVPTELSGDLQIVAVPKRESPNEAFISRYAWDEMPDDSRLGTSSLRREAFCNYHKKNFKLEPIRGNIDTRIKKVLDGDYDGTIMAEAGLKRLGLTQHITERFSLEYFTPPAGQGALAIIARRDSKLKEILAKLNHFQSAQGVIAEKTVLAELGVGCQWPLGVSARTDNDKLELYSILLTREGKVISKIKLNGLLKDAEELGKKAARAMMEDFCE
ncbi:MAG: hydroxymethylbilane synthase [Euryarchaeota archaeon]|nr:hydroxymethylbilane synthase [Euryarchaeota archaeon]